MDDATNPCPICDGRGFLECDDGSEVLCEHCEGTGVVTEVIALGEGALTA